MASVPLLSVGLGSELPRQSRSQVASDSPSRRSASCAHEVTTNAWYQCAGGGRGGYISSAVCQKESSQDGQTGSPPVPVRKPSPNVYFSYPHCVDHRGERGKLGGGEKKQRVSGTAGAPTSGRGLVWVDPDEAGFHPQHMQPHLLLPLPWRLLLLQPSATAWVGKPLCAMKLP